jgi:hypothetical protein
MLRESPEPVAGGGLAIGSCRRDDSQPPAAAFTAVPDIEAVPPSDRSRLEPQKRTNR